MLHYQLIPRSYKILPKVFNLSPQVIIIYLALLFNGVYIAESLEGVKAPLENLIQPTPLILVSYANGDDMCPYILIIHVYQHVIFRAV